MILRMFRTHEGGEKIARKIDDDDRKRQSKEHVDKRSYKRGVTIAITKPSTKRAIKASRKRENLKNVSPKKILDVK